MQKIYIFILSKTYILTGKIDENKRNVIIGICSFLIISNCFMYTGWSKLDIGLYIRYAELLPVNTLLFCIIILFSVNGDLDIVKWEKKLYIPWMICWVIVLITGLHHNISDSFMFTAATMLIIMPCFYMVWNSRRDIITLYRVFCKAAVLALVVYFIMNLMKFPLIEGEAYYGVSVNPNSNGLIGLAGTIAVLYLICIERPKWYYIIAAGMSVALVYLSASRASAIATTMVTGVFIICYLRSCRERRMKGYIASAVVAITVAVILASCIGYNYALINLTPKVNEFIESAEANNIVYAEETNGSQLIENSTIINKFEREGDLSSISSGRTQIWKEYIESLNLAGNERDREGLYIKSLGRNASAHNSYIEIAYRSGMIAGLIYTFIAIYAAVYSFRFIFGKKVFEYRLSFIPMAVMAFGVMSNLERAIYPFEKVHILMFFIALTPLFLSRSKSKSSEVKEDRDY